MKKEKKVKQSTCNVCGCSFSLEEEGGIAGDFGILPVEFCPTCFACMQDMVEQINVPACCEGWREFSVDKNCAFLYCPECGKKY